MHNINFKLAGLTCQSCAQLAAKRFKTVPGVRSVSIDSTSGAAVVFSESELDLTKLAQSLEGTHYSIIR